MTIKAKPIFWHRVGVANQRKILANNGPRKTTVAQFQKRFRQPSWRSYPGALAGIMGCWSLMIPGRIRDYGSCKNCELRITKKKGGNAPQ